LFEKQPHPTKNTGRIAGFLYLLASIAAGFNILYVLPTLFVPGNATETASNILASETLFRIGILAELISAIVLFLCARALYRLLNGVNKGYASLMVTFVLVAVPISFLNALNEIAALELLGGASFLSVFQKSQLDALAVMFLNLHSDGLDIVNIFWGLWLLPFGVLVYRSGFFPRILGVFLVIACFGYVTQSLVPLLSLPYGNVISPVTDALGALGEVPMMVWLLVMNPR
jgi:hypothetical protein